MRVWSPLLLSLLASGCAHRAVTTLARAPFELAHTGDPRARFDRSWVRSYTFGPGHRWQYVDPAGTALPTGGSWQLAGRRLDLHSDGAWPDQNGSLLLDPVYLALVVHDGREYLVSWSEDLCDHLDAVDWTREESRPAGPKMAGFTLDFCAGR